ncbi:hypothetical protein [Oricola sp.]|uniref:hypothetical protein n=1 Tax=Oricola sp. TaxID=1979950 RepID=UPI003BA909D1
MGFRAKNYLFATTILAGTVIPAGAQESAFDVLDDTSQMEAWGVSSDGTIVVGELGAQAMRVTVGGTPEQIGGQDALAISGDGSTIVGFEIINTIDFAVRWNGDGSGMQQLSTSFADNSGSATETRAYGVSHDGNVIVGVAVDSTTSLDQFAVQWAGGDLSRLTGMPAGSKSFAYDVSADGKSIVGTYFSIVPEVDGTAFIWTESGLTPLGMLNGGTGAVARAISNDGSVVVGRAVSGGFPVVYAVRWENGGPAESLGDLASGAGGSEAFDISDDGKVIVGTTSVYNGGIRTRAFRWENGAMQTVEDWLRNASVTIAEDVTLAAHGTNADGSVIVGKATDDRIFIARVTNGDTGGGDTGGGDTGGGDTGGGDTGGGDTGGGDTGGGDTGGGDTGGGDTGGGDTGGGDTGGGDTGGGDTGGGDTGGGGDVDSGLVFVEDVADSLADAGATSSSVLSNMNIQLNGAGSRPLDRRASPDRSIVWATGDLGSLSQPGGNGNFGLVEFGGGHNFGPVQINGTLGGARQSIGTALGGETELETLSAKLEAISLVHGTEDRGLWAVVTAAGVIGNADIRRNYLANAGSVVTSKGTTDISGVGLRGRAQWENALPNLSPFAELAWSNACMDRYTESGGPAPAIFAKKCSSETLARYGVDATVPVTETFRVTGTLQGVHRIGGSNDATSGQLIGLEAFSLPGSQGPEDWIRGGAGFEVDVTDQSVFSLMVSGTAGGGSSNAWVSASWRKAF